MIIEDVWVWSWVEIEGMFVNILCLAILIAR